MAITKVQTPVTAPTIVSSGAAPVNTSTQAVTPSAPQPADSFKTGSASTPAVGAAPASPQAQPSMTRPFADKPAPTASSLTIDYTAARSVGAPKDNATAVSNADMILRGPDYGDAPSPGMSAHAVHNRVPPPVNNPDDNDPNSERFQAATAQVQLNAPLESAAVAKLSTLNQGKYQTLKTALTSDPVAQLSLQKLLFQGKLPGVMDIHGTGTLMENLNKLATTSSLAPNINRTNLLASVTQEIATPSAIHQGGADTCGATSAAIQLALQTPSEYVRIVSGLAGPEGKVTLTGTDPETAKSAVLRRLPDTETDDGSGRSVSQRILAPSLMDYADGSSLKYVLGKATGGAGDEHIGLQPGLAAQKGLYADQDARLQTAIQAKTFVPYPPQRGMTADGAVGMQKLQALIGQGATVNATIVIGGQGDSRLHTVTVTGVDPNGPPAGWVKYVNPWGREEQMPIPEFQHRMDSLTYPQGLLPDAPVSSSSPQSPATVNALNRGFVQG